jgi:selenocysteine lyase/cysteine desulfurase
LRRFKARFTTSRGPGSASPLRRRRRSEQALFARLVHADREDVAIASQVSACVSLIESSLQDGAEVVCAQEDFMSLLYPFLVRPRIRVRSVPLEQISQAVDERTTLARVRSIFRKLGVNSRADAVARGRELGLR